MLTRRVLLGDRFLIDEFVVDGEAPDTLDWFLRAPGKLELSVAASLIEEVALAPAYTYLKDLRGSETNGDWRATWSFGKPEAEGDRGRLIVTMKGLAGTQVTQAEAPGGATLGELWGTLRVRRNAAQTRFVAVHQTVPAGADPVPVSFGDRTIRVGNANIELGADDGLAPVLR